MEKVIEITNRAVADYGFRLAVLYGSEDISRRWGLLDEERAVLESPGLELLASLPNPVEPDAVPEEQARVANLIRSAAGS